MSSRVVCLQGSLVQEHFWDLEPSARIAFSGPDFSVTYEEFHRDVETFRGRLDVGRGLLLLCCDNDYRQYVAYVAALSARCPVILSDAAATAEGQAFPVSYVYRPYADALVTRAGVAPELHSDLAVLLSTSGSTGAAKSVRLSRANIAANAASIVEYLQIGAEDCAALTLPFQYSYGMSVVNSHLMAGAEIALIPHSVSSTAFWKSFEAQGCTSLAGVPHSFDLMTQGGVDTSRLSRLRYMTQAGGKMAPRAIKTWTRRAQTEGWSFVVMYGQTEAAPRMAYLPAEAALDNADSIGRAIPGGKLEIRDETGALVPDGVEGELVYTGANVMMGYAREPRDLALGQGPDELRTGDLARRLPNGLFKITGRQSRFVKLFGYRVSLDEIDGRLAGEGIAAATAARGEEIHVLAKIDLGTTAILALDLDEWLSFPRGTVRVHPVDELPRNANGKIDGPRVRAMVEALATAAPPAAADGPAQSAADIFSIHFSGRAIDADTTFTQLGGDSLNYLSVALDLETMLGEVPPGWEALSVRKLDAHKPSKRAGIALDTPTLLRALAIVLLAGGHLGAFAYGGGGALTLFLVAGFSFGAFTLPAVLGTQSVVPIAVLGARVGLFTLLAIAANWILTGYGSWPAALFISNWIGPQVDGGAWFVDVYLQCLIILTGLLMIPQLRRVLEKAPFGGLAIAAVGAIALSLGVEALFETHHLYRRLPFLLGWILLCGAAAQAARSWTDRAVVTAIAATGVAGFFGLGAQIFFVAALLAVIWIPHVRLPRFAATAIRTVATASLAIYLTHFQFASLAEQAGITTSAIKLLIAILGGIVVWRVYLHLDRIAALVLRRGFRKPWRALRTTS